MQSQEITESYGRLASHIQTVRMRVMDENSKWFEQNDPEELYRHPVHSWRVQRILHFTKDIQGRILDIGCFAGYVSEQVIKQGGKVVIGTDCLEKALEIASARGVHTILADLNDAAIDFPDNHFDCVLAGEVLDYVFDPDAVVEEIHRVLKPEGTFIVTVPNLASIGNRILLMLGRPPYGWQVRPCQGGYWRYFTFDTLRRLLYDHGYDIKATESSVFVCPLIRFNLNRWPLNRVPGLRKIVVPVREWKRHRLYFSKVLARILPRMGENIIVVAEKPKEEMS